MCMNVRECVWRPEDNLRCDFLDDDHFLFGSRVSHWVTTCQVPLPPRTGIITICYHIWSFKIQFVGKEPRSFYLQGPFCLVWDWAFCLVPLMCFMLTTRDNCPAKQSREVSVRFLLWLQFYYSNLLTSSKCGNSFFFWK